MTDSTPSSIAAARQRLERLEGFLRQDPTNSHLLIDAFETALACAEWERARFHLKHGESLGADPLAWRLREGDFWLAQQRYDEAQRVLEALVPTPNPPAGFADVLLHNLAYIDLRQGQRAACVARLAPVLEGSTREGEASAPSAATRALQQLWLRALHLQGELDRAMAWTQAAEKSGRVDPQAAGVASLVAIDAGDFTSAQRWLNASLQDGGPADHPVEALVAQATILLAARDANRARQFASLALQRHPHDGRAWSTRGFAALLAGDPKTALDAFGRALSVMGQHIGTWHGLAWTQILAGDLPAARASFESALALDRNFAESHGGLAVVLAMQQQRQDAEAHAETALRLDRNNLSGRYARALLGGEVRSAEDVQRLARRLFGGRGGPLGGDMGDWFTGGKDPSGTEGGN